MIVAANATAFGFGNRPNAFWLSATQDSWSYTEPQTADTADGLSIALTTDAGGGVVAAYPGWYIGSSSVRWEIIVHKIGADGVWSLIGNPIASQYQLSGVSIVTDAAGIPLIAWIDSSSNATDTWVSVAQWNNASKTWVLLGDAAATRSTSNSQTSVAVGSDGKALVAWSGVAASERSIWVARREGNAWQLVGSPLSALSAGNTAASNPVLAIDGAGYPLVAWHETDGSAASVSDIYVYRYNY
jgi:drug/metabolite transporter superfamily protein YnfA